MTTKPNVIRDGSALERRIVRGIGKTHKGHRQPRLRNRPISNGNYIQEGYTAIAPYLYAKLELVGFLKNAFGAEVTHTPTPDGSGDFTPRARSASRSCCSAAVTSAIRQWPPPSYLYVTDVDATYQRALSLGAKAVREPSDQTWAIVWAA